MSPLQKTEALSILPARRYCQSQPWIWSCSVAGSLLMFSVWYLGPIPISKGGPPGALTFWSAWRLSRPPACGISCQREQTTPLLQNIHPPPLSSSLHCFIALHCAPSFRETARSPSGPNWVWSCIPFATLLTMVGEILKMISIAAGRILVQSEDHFVFKRDHSVNALQKLQRLLRGLWPF